MDTAAALGDIGRVAPDLCVDPVVADMCAVPVGADSYGEAGTTTGSDIVRSTGPTMARDSITAVTIPITARMYLHTGATQVTTRTIPITVIRQ